MKIREVKIIKSVLSKTIGWSWPLFLVKCLIKGNAIFGKTHWAEVKSQELRLVKRLSLVCALYVGLGDKTGKEKAFEIMKKMLLAIGCSEQWNHLNSLNLSKDSGMVGLMYFNDLMDKKGAPQFNKREYVKQNNNICHFIITRCVFYDFFTETGTPELTRLFCEVDREFFPRAFPDFRFYRGTSWENTIAYGKDRCDFIFEKES
jgi:hypothetical protein